jgi:hypothetical protein
MFEVTISVIVPQPVKATIAAAQIAHPMNRFMKDEACRLVGI